MFTQIAIHNIRGITKTIDLPPGVTCLVGPNGVGKSTVVECLAYTLFGSSCIRGTVNELFTAEDSSITIKGYYPEPFEITRTKKNSEFRTAKDVQIGAKDITAYFTKVFGSADMFKNIFVANQNAVSEIANTRTGLRKKLLAELLGLQDLDEAIRETALHAGVKKPATTLQEAEAELKELEERTAGLDFDTLVKVSTAQDELQKIESLGFDLDQANANKALLQSAHDNCMTSAATGAALLAIKQEVFSLLSQCAGDGKCPVCYSPMDPQHKQTIQKEIEQLNTHVEDMKMKMKAYAGILQKIVQAAKYRKPAELKAIIGDIKDPKGLHGALINKGLLQGTVDHLRDLWKQYEETRPFVELNTHLSEFRTAVTHKYFSELTSLVQSYLLNYTKFRNFEMNEEFDIYVDGRGIWTYSGGQRDLICTILRIALSRVVSEARFGRCLFAIFDSTFDSIDKRGLLTSLELLRDSGFDRVMVSTHNEFPTIMGLNVIKL